MWHDSRKMELNHQMKPSFKVEDSQFESDKAWVTGNVPKIKPVHVEGDTSIINAWFKGETYDKSICDHGLCGM